MLKDLVGTLIAGAVHGQHGCPAVKALGQDLL
jgi:hypothetical protein